MLVRQGHNIETAAAFVGVGKSSLYRWLVKSAEQERGAYRDFREAIKRALAEGEIRDLAMIRAAAEKGAWQAAAWRLERRDPARFGRVSRHRIAAAREDPLEDCERPARDRLDALSSDPEALAALEVLAKRRRAVAAVQSGSDRQESASPVTVTC